MTSNDGEQQLRGLARSIDDLFASLEGSDGPEENSAAGEVADPTGKDGGDAAADTTAPPAGSRPPDRSPERASDGPSDRPTDPSPGGGSDGPPTVPPGVASADPLMDVEVVEVAEAEETGPAAEESPGPVGLDAVELTDVPEEGAERDEVVARAAGQLDPDAGGAGPIPGEATPPAPDPDPAAEAFAEFDGPATGERAGPTFPSETPPDDPSDPGDALAVAVERYLSGEGARRDELSRRIRDLAGALREANRNEPLADAAERLVVAGRRHGEQEAPLALARLLATPSVATVVTHRLGSTRDEERRRQLAEVAAALGREIAPALADALSSTDDRSARRAYMGALVAMGDDAMDEVEAMVGDSRWFVVRNAVLILGEGGGESSVQHLTTTLAHDDARVRRETVLALAKIGGDDATVLARNKLDDVDPHVRSAAALALGELGGEREVRVLVARLEEEKEQEAQVAILRALGQLGDPGAVPAIEKRAVTGFFSKPPTDVRVAAYRALAAIGTPHARELLEKAADDRDPAVRRVATEAAGG